MEFNTRKVVVKTEFLKDLYVYLKETEESATLTISHSSTRKIDSILPNKNDDNDIGHHIATLDADTSLSLQLKSDVSVAKIGETIDFLGKIQSVIKRHMHYNTENGLEEVNQMNELDGIQTDIGACMKQLQEICDQASYINKED